MNPNLKLLDKHQPVYAFAAAVPSSAAPTRVSLKNFWRATVLLLCKNGASGVVGSAITLKQSTTVAGAGEKSLPFTKVDRCLDPSTTDVFVAAAVASNTFTTDATVSKNPVYAIDVTPEMLDIANNFDCFTVGLGDATAATIAVVIILHGKLGTPEPSAIID